VRSKISPDRVVEYFLEYFVTNPIKVLYVSEVGRSKSPGHFVPEDILTGLDSGEFDIAIFERKGWDEEFIGIDYVVPNVVAKNVLKGKVPCDSMYVYECLPEVFRKVPISSTVEGKLVTIEFPAFRNYLVKRNGLDLALHNKLEHAKCEKKSWGLYEGYSFALICKAEKDKLI